MGNVRSKSNFVNHRSVVTFPMTPMKYLLYHVETNHVAKEAQEAPTGYYQAGEEGQGRAPRSPVRVLTIYERNYGL